MKTSRRRFLTHVASVLPGNWLFFASRAADAQTASPHYDVAVVGAGSGGLGAAIAAARGDLRVLLVEKSDRLGGTAVASGVTMWEPGVGGTGLPFDIYRRLKTIPEAVSAYSFGRHCMWNGWDAFPGGEYVVDPERRYVDTLQRHGGSGEEFKRTVCHGVVFDPDAYEGVARTMLDQTKRCTIATRTTFSSAKVEGNRVAALTLADGRQVTADYFIDATGGGALCAACGCERMIGREGRQRFNEPSAAETPNELLNGVTLIYRITPVPDPAIEPLPEGVPTECWWRQSFPAVSATRYPNGDYNFNTLPTMEGVECLKMAPDEAYAECKRRVYAHWHYVQTNYPEFQRYRIDRMAPALGVRETYRVVTDYILTEHDLKAGLSAQQHPDIVTIADHSVDRHGKESGGYEMREPYGVPYRCLIPKGFSNLLVACRGAGFSSLAASSCRLSRTIMQLGQAAGTATLLAARGHIDLPDVSPEDLRTALREQHCQLDWPLPDTLRDYLQTE
ncbi:MAG TPA: FAD-dependent oxidoreductase [Candidatus Hydrogenedentes bacterium]|nr:FAD-dependent oxidoreductase [Candidatus Hydrogenedentota bacterium]HPG68989.1 FAD-dependent oxidoreductase [Candidatus Hydrogenedentota bacterium]